MMRNRILFLAILIIALASCSEESKKSPVVNQQEIAVDSVALEADYINMGKTIVKSTFKALSGQLKLQIMEGGPVQALSFCNINAQALTDSLSNEFDAKIQRVAIDYRNPENKAVGYDLEVFEMYEKGRRENWRKLNAVVHYNDSDQAVFYAPIILKQQCVICHGNTGDEIDDSTLMTIMSLYPDDKAVGYSAGDLRGMWKVTFNK